MSDPTNEQVIEDLKNKLAAAHETLAQATETVKRQTAQINSLRENIGTVKDLPQEVAADVRERIAAGLPREIAIERALAQHQHLDKLHDALTEDEQDRVSELLAKVKTPSFDQIGQAIAVAKHEGILAKAKASAATETKPGKAK